MGLLDIFRRGAGPPVNKPPRGASGRGHTDGFLELEELNNDLKHPRGHQVYDRMYRTDGDVRQVVQLISNPILAGTWAVVPYGGEAAKPRDVEVAEAVRWALWEAMEPNLFGHLATALPILTRSGFCPFEVAWTRAEYVSAAGKKMQMVVPRTLSVRLPRTIEEFEQDRFGNLTRIKQYLPVPHSTLTARDGIVRSSIDEPHWVWIDAKNLVYYRVGAEGDNWEGTSLLRPAYKHWLLKDKIERIDAIAQEREAVGVPICYPPLGASPEQLSEMEAVLEAMRSNEQAYIIAPGPKAGKGAPDGQGWLVEVIGYERTGSGRDPQPSLEYHTQKIAAAFISEFMRLGHGQTGARATAQVQADPFQMSVEALVGVVEQTLNEQLVAPLTAYNFADVDNPPKLQMSLVDSTSLSQLADYVLKLTQIGALMPDQELEDFLRARADLPAANPESVKKRKKEDDELRRMIVTGGGGNGDAYGQNSKPGIPHGNKSAGVKSQSGGGAASTRDGIDEGSVTLGMDDASLRPLRRDPVDVELAVDWYALEYEMDSAPAMFEDIVGDGVFLAAQEMASDKSPLGHFGDDSECQKKMRSAVMDGLTYFYELGGGYVLEEVNAQAETYGMVEASLQLDRGAHDRGIAHLGQRADIIVDRLVTDMREAMLNADLMYGDHDPSARLVAAEKAGMAGLRRAGRSHGVGAFLLGRHDEGMRLANEDNGLTIGVRYSAILDRNTCESCEEADDGRVRALDDPVRLDRRPPNRHCHSTASGENRCRCTEVYEVVPPENLAPTLLEDTSGLHPFIARVAEALIARGMPSQRALTVAVGIAKSYCTTGKIRWPGIRSVDPGTRAEACEAVAGL